MDKRKKVLIINECFSDNVGDQAIARGLKSVFTEGGYEVCNVGFSAARSAGSGARVGMPSYRVGLRRFLSNSIALKSIRWFFLNINRVIRVSVKKQDFVVIGGGQLVMERSNFAVAMFVWIFFLKLFKNKVYLVSVGIGESFNFFEKWLYSLSFKMVEGIYLREASGLERLKRLFNVQAQYSPDAAYALPVIQAGLNERLRVAVCVTDYYIYERHAAEFGNPILSREKYWEEWARFIASYAGGNRELRFLWTTESDKKETIDFLKNIHLTCSYSIFEKDLSLATVIDELVLSESVISGRMHGLILGHICGAKPIPWVISKKIEHFANEYLLKSPRELQNQFLEVVRRDFI